MENIDFTLLTRKIGALEKELHQKEKELDGFKSGNGEATAKPENMHTNEMSNLSREELDAKLQLVEERIGRSVQDIARSVDELKASNTKTVDALAGAKWWAIGTAIAVLAIFLGTLQWGLSAQKEENARFSSYIRDDVKDISNAVQEISKSVTEIRIKSERSPDPKQ